jgi:hypothetical protein
MFEVKAFRTIIRTYSLFKSERLSVNIKLTLHRALIISVMICLSRLGINGGHVLHLKIVAPEKQGQRFEHGFQPSICIQLYNKNHKNEHVRGIGKGEARLRKYKRLKLGGGQAYDRSYD